MRIAAEAVEPVRSTVRVVSRGLHALCTLAHLAALTNCGLRMLTVMTVVCYERQGLCHSCKIKEAQAMSLSRVHHVCQRPITQLLAG